MSNAKHTPGPWEAVKYGSDWTVRRVGADKNEADITDTFHDKVSLMEGNAKLIAAAPDMAEALKSIISWMDQSREREGKTDFMIFPEAPEISKARAALAKAGVE